MPTSISNNSVAEILAVWQIEGPRGALHFFWHRVFGFWKAVLIKYDHVHSRHLQTRYSSYDAPIVGHQTRILEG